MICLSRQLLSISMRGIFAVSVCFLLFGFAVNIQEVQGQPPQAGMYRLYKPVSGDHFYTTSLNERDDAIQNLGYIDEGIAFDVFLSRYIGTVPLYRLYKTSSGDHFYTIDAKERDAAIANDGYAFELIAAHVYPTQSTNSVPLYRLYNQTSRKHFYTTSVAEVDYATTYDGFTYERVECYVL